LGLNAIYATARLAGFIEDLANRMAQERPFNELLEPASSTLHIGTFHGGSAVNIIPEHATRNFEVLTIPNQDPAEIVSLIIREQERLASLSGTEPFHFELSSYPSLRAKSSDLVALMIELTGGPLRQSVSYGTGAGLFQQAGIAAIICGPGAIERAHKPNEYILANELADCMSMFRGLAARLSA
jgi:acetylornithine deacetylase